MYENQTPPTRRQEGNPLEASKLLTSAFKNTIEVFEYLSDGEIYMHEVSLLGALNDHYEIVGANCRSGKEQIFFTWDGQPQKATKENIQAYLSKLAEQAYFE